MTKKRQAEVLRSARIFNEHGIATIARAPFVHVLADSAGAGYTDLAKVVNPGKIPWYERAQTKPFYGRVRGEGGVLEEAFAYAITATGIPREQWTTSPFGRTTWFPIAAIDAALAYANAKVKENGAYVREGKA